MNNKSKRLVGIIGIALIATASGGIVSRLASGEWNTRGFIIGGIAGLAFAVVAMYRRK
jgi:hypothetical protein